MTNTALFLDDAVKISFEKLGMAIKLSDNVDNWQREISSEIYKHLPYLNEYAVNVLLQRVNPERGYAFGSAQVMTKKETPQKEGPTVLIPLIVADRLLKPLDVFMFEGKAYPLSEQRLRESLFDGRTFETSARKPVDQGMVDQLYPPIRTNYGYGSGVTTGAAAGGAGFGKFASLCEAIAPTISDKDVDDLVEKIASDQQLSAALRTNESFCKLTELIVRSPRVSMEKTAASLVQSIKPTVVQFTKMADGNFKIKWANAEAFAPQETTANPGDAAQMAGGDQLQGMQPGQSVTVGTESAEKSLEDPIPVEVKEFGQYQVRAEGGEDKEGWVIPIIDFDMTDMPLMLFTNGECYSLQDEMVGVRIGESAEGIPETEPQGDGAFFYVKADGKVVATMPITIQNQSQGPDGGLTHMCETAMGEQIQLTVTPGLQQIQPMGKGHYGIPDTMRFTPLTQPIHVTPTADAAGQIKEARLNPKRAHVSSTGQNEFHLRGMPFRKLAADQAHFLDRNAAEFVLVAAGLSQLQVREKLASSLCGNLVPIDGLNTLIPLAERHDEAVKEAALVLQNYPDNMRRDTVKLAAALEDSETADKILAMNFLNPQNVAIFASYMPQLDESAQKLAEMLMAARMGMQQLDEGTLERAMLNVEEIIQSLKTLEQKQLL